MLFVWSELGLNSTLNLIGLMPRIESVHWKNGVSLGYWNTADGKVWHSIVDRQPIREELPNSLADNNRVRLWFHNKCNDCWLLFGLLSDNHILNHKSLTITSLIFSQLFIGITSKNQFICNYFNIFITISVGIRSISFWLSYCSSSPK